MRSNCTEYIFRMENGTPIKPVKVAKANAKCKHCGRKIRFIRSEFGQLIPAEDKLNIVDPGASPFDAEKFITRDGMELSGVIVERGRSGCRLGFKVHKCRERSVE